MATTSNTWRGMTLEELRMKRAKALIMTEVNKAPLVADFQLAKSKTRSHGIRALIFNNNELSGLKLTDYLLIGVKTAMLGAKLWKKYKK